MKKFKLLTVVFLLSTLFVGFNACSNDDDEGGKKEETPTGSLIKQVTFKSLDGSWSFLNFVADMSYSGNKITSCKISNQLFPLIYANVNVIYQDNKIIVTSKGEDDEERWLNGEYTFTFTMKDGYAISCEKKVRYENDDKYYISNINFYYKDGYLSRVILKDTWSNEEELYFNYVDDNSLIVKHTEGWDGGNTRTTEYNFKASKIENKNNFPVELYFIPANINADFNCLYMSYLGIFGKTPNYYPVSVDSDSDIDPDRRKWTFDYKLDDNKNITSASWEEWGEGSEYSLGFTFK